MNTPPTAPPTYPRFCPTCGNPLPGPVPLCPRCGTNIGAVTGAKRGGLGGLAIAAIVVAIVIVGISCVGILAAIAIPNFLRYQLRSKASEVSVNMQALVRSEEAQRQGSGKYVALPRVPAGEPGTQKAPLSPGELEAAAALDWMAGPALYGRYAVAVSEDGTGAAICGESDIDGDGVLAVQVAFLPDEAGEAPPAPCTEPVPFGDQAPLVVEKLTDDSVF